MRKGNRMFLSLALLVLAGILAGKLCKLVRIPPLVGMIAVGICFGPQVLNIIDPSLLAASAYLRKIALVIILSRAGLSLNFSELRSVGRPAVLLCFVPACCEIIAVTLLAPWLLGVSYIEAAVMGSVVAAVSPAIVVPRMLLLMDQGYGTDHGVPQMILAGSSVDDVFVIVMFTAFTSLAQGGNPGFFQFAQIPISIATGVGVGLGIGWLLSLLFSRVESSDAMKVVIFISVAFLLVGIEDAVGTVVPFSSLLGVMAMGMMLRIKLPEVAGKIAFSFGGLWVGAELLLFLLVGASVNIGVALAAGWSAIFLVILSLIVRMVGVAGCMLGTKLDGKERLFCMMAYTPKATVQAAIGAVPLAMGLACGQIVLTVAVLSILLTAPIGAVCIDRSYRRLLRHTPVRN